MFTKTHQNMKNIKKQKQIPFSDSLDDIPCDFHKLTPEKIKLILQARGLKETATVSGLLRPYLDDFDRKEHNEPWHIGYFNGEVDVQIYPKDFGGKYAFWFCHEDTNFVNMPRLFYGSAEQLGMDYEEGVFSEEEEEAQFTEDSDDDSNEDSSEERESNSSDDLSEAKGEAKEKAPKRKAKSKTPKREGEPLFQSFEREAQKDMDFDRNLKKDFEIRDMRKCLEKSAALLNECNRYFEHNHTHNHTHNHGRSNAYSYKYKHNTKKRTRFPDLGDLDDEDIIIDEDIVDANDEASDEVDVDGEIPIQNLKKAGGKIKVTKTNVYTEVKHFNRWLFVGKHIYCKGLWYHWRVRHLRTVYKKGKKIVQTVRGHYVLDRTQP